MNKWIGIKKEVINLRSLLINYKKIIPKQQLPRFEKDIDLLFEKYQAIENEQELEKMKKLAKTKLNSMIRVYGELKEEETTVEKEFLDEASKKMADKMIKENANEKEESAYNVNEDYITRLNKIKNSDYFNKNIVNKAHKEFENYQNMVLEAQTKAEEKIKEDLKKDYETNKNAWIEKYIQKLKNLVHDLCLKKEVSNIEQTMESIDFEKMAYQFIDMDLNSEKYSNDDKGERLEDIMNSFENILSGSKKTEELFVNFRKNSIGEKIDELSKNEDLKTFLDQKLEKIKNDENMTIEEKAKTFIKEQWKAENDIIRENIDGEIRVNPYGNIEVDFYKENNSSDKTEAESEESNENTGVKTFHWKNGKLVEGKAKQRQTTTYSNWHTGNVNPDDLKRHRSLLDRQHYSGPLWEGIKPKSIINDPTVFMDIDDYRNSKPEDPLIKIDDKGKHEWEEIVR